MNDFLIVNTAICSGIAFILLIGTVIFFTLRAKISPKKRIIRIVIPVICGGIIVGGLIIGSQKNCKEDRPKYVSD